MIVEQTLLDGVMRLKPQVFEDHRGEYVELFNEKEFQELCAPLKFVQDDISVSCQHVLRGIHGDRETYKLISCLLGQLYLVIVNCIEGSKDFGRWQSFALSEKKRHQILVPPQHGVAHLALSERIIFHYKQTTYYNPKSQFTYKWNEPKFNIWWPTKSPILSQRDEFGHYV